MDKKSLKKGATADQKFAIDYLMSSGIIYMLKRLFIGKSMDERYDAIVKSMVESYNPRKRAMDKIGLDESEISEIPPVVFAGYSGDYGVENKSGQLRSDEYTVTHIFFSATQVYMHKVTFSTIKSLKKESTEEFFYKDVTNFSTYSGEVKYTVYKGFFIFKKPFKAEMAVQEFAMTAGGEKFTCSTSGDIDQTVRGMKNKLREKKM